MFEVQAANFKKGIFELHLRKAVKIPLLAPIFRLGPVRGRLIGLAGLLFAFLLSMNKAPSRFFLENGWASDEVEALLQQDRLMWTLVVVCALFYLLVSLLREAHLELDFDRQKEAIYFHFSPTFVLSRRKEGLIGFREVRKVEVFAPDREPKTSFGRIRIQGPATAPIPFRELDFALLSDEQREFFPLNLSRLMDIQPVGDWIDPDTVLED
ncbi:hypothetical protein GW915_05420 [bacterium]|nr:hypothetical protein [bacterium]